jgi:hypothetical protein
LLLLPLRPAHAEPSLAGIWYGEGQPDDPDVVYLDFFSADGTFISEFRRYDNCKVVADSVQSGTWTSKGNVQYLVTTQVDGKPADFKHSYTIELLTNTEVRARLREKSKFLFVEQRIDRFQFPNCFRGS